MGKEAELLEAARTGDVDIIEKILSTKSRSKGPLAFASLRKGIGPNIQDPNGDTPIHHASLNGHGKAVQTLLHLDASANMMDNKGCYPIHLAAWRGNDDICDILLTQGPSIAKVNEQNNEGDTPLHYACQYGHTKTVDVLLKEGADVKIRNKLNESALDLASQYGHLECVKLLLNQDRTLIQDKTTTHSPLHLAARNGHKHVVQRLIEAGFDINTTTELGSALHEALLYGKQDIVKLLLEHDIDAELKDKDGNTALHNLERYNSERTAGMKTLLQEYIEKQRIPILDRVSAGQEDLYDTPLPWMPETPDRQSMYDNMPAIQKPTPKPRGSVFRDITQKESAIAPPTESPPEVPKLSREEATSSIYDVPAGIYPLKTDNSSASPELNRIHVPSGYVLMSPTKQASSSPNRSPDMVPKKPPRKRTPDSRVLGSSFKDKLQHEIATTHTQSESTDGINDSDKKEETNSATQSEHKTHPPTLEFEKKRESKATPLSPTGYVQPPTPDFPPPSPHTAVIGIQEMINPNDKRKSQDMETSTDKSDLLQQNDNRSKYNQEQEDNQLEDSNMKSVSSKGGQQDAPPAEAREEQSKHNTNEQSIEKLQKQGISSENKLNESEIKTDFVPENIGNIDEAVVAQEDYGLHDEGGNNNETSQRKGNGANLNPFLGLIKGANPSGSRRVATQIYENVLPQQIQRKGSRSKRASAPVNYVGFDPGAIPEEKVVETRGETTKVMMRPKRENRESTRQTKLDSDTGSQDDASAPLDDEAEWAQIADIMASFGGGITRESVFVRDFEDTFANFLSGGKKIQSVSDWLEDLGLSQYENALVANGFDDIDFIGSNVLEDEDLIEIGVSNESHRRKILEAAKSIPLVIPLGDHNMPVTVEAWLTSLRLHDYLDSFLTNNFMSMHQIRKIWATQLNVLNLSVLGHRKRILASLGERLGEERMESVGSLKHLEWSSNPLTSVSKSSEDESPGATPDRTDLNFFKDYSGVKPKYEGPSKPNVLSPTENKSLKFPTIPENDVFAREGDGVEEDFLRIRPPQLTAMQSSIKQWRHRPEVLIKGCCNYSSQYLGSTLVKELRGTESTKESIKKLKKMTANVSKTPQIMLSISYRGVKFIDAKTRKVVSEHEVSNIFCACQDGDDLNYFAYITKDLQTKNLYCHVFKVKTMDLAAEIILTLGEAFEVAYQVAMKEKAAASAQEFERKLSESGASSGVGTM